jgi:hypothetical protein
MLFMAAGLSVSAAANALSHFPAIVGNTWEFSYTLRTTLTTWPPIGNTDSGTVVWKIIGYSVKESFPEQIMIGIQQTRTLVQKKGTRGDNTAYDSTITPPRKTTDTLRLRGTGDSNGLMFEDDSVWSFVYDPLGTIPTGKLDIRDTTVVLDSGIVKASVIDNRPGRIPSAVEKQPGPDFFITSSIIGPVGRYRASPPFIVGGTLSERWQLKTATILNTAIRAPLQRPTPSSDFTVSTFNRGTINVSFRLEKSSPVLLQAFDLKGRLLSTLICGFHAGGMHHLQWNDLTWPTGHYIARFNAEGTERLRQFRITR